MSLEYVLDNIWLKEHSITVKWIVLFHEDFEPEFNALREEVQGEIFEGWPGAARIGVNGSYELRDLKASYDPPFTLKNIDLSAENTQYWDVSD